MVCNVFEHFLPLITSKWSKMKVNEVQISTVLTYHQVTYQITRHVISNFKNNNKNKTTAENTEV